MQILGAVAAIAMLAAAPAFADIASFNAAVKAGDFKKAATEAAATWPQLDKSREDIGLIAREFGFAAYVATDYAAARSYSEFAASKTSSDADGLLSNVLLRLSEHKLKLSNGTRENLNEALVARTALPGFDVISFLGADTLVAYDFEKGRWKNAAASSDMAVKLTEAAGPSYAVQRRRFALFAAVAEYMATEEPAVYDQFTALKKAVVDEIDAAASEEAAARFAPLYWEIKAWQETLDAHLSALGKKRPPPVYGFDMEQALNVTERRKTLLHQYPPFNPCHRRMELSKHPQYPGSALYRGFVGTVVLRMDIDAGGKPINPEVLAAVPEKYFGKTALDSVKNISFEKGASWDEAKCSMAEQGHVVIYSFRFPDR